MQRTLFGLVALALISAPASAAGFGVFASGWDSEAAADELLGGGLYVGIPLGQLLDLDLRATYYQEGDLSNVGEEADVFRDRSIRVVPIEAGVRFNLLRDSAFNPYVGAGATYFLLDHDVDRFALDDEIGWNVNGGIRLGGEGGAGFFAEAIYRSAEATLEGQEGAGFPDPDEVDVVDEVALDLDGIAVNLGVVFGF
jgi:hypothetical protein